MDTTLARVQIGDEHDAAGSNVTRLWMDFILGANSPHEARLEVSSKTKAHEVDPGGELFASFVNERNDGATTVRHDLLWRVRNGLVRVEDIYNKLRIRVAVDGAQEDAIDILTKVREGVVPIRDVQSNEVKVRFWRMTPQGGQAFQRNIEAPTWQAIEHNYASLAAKQLGELVKLKPRQISSGKIILLHGTAGTGKTTAIRAIAREWRKWCELNYAIDPERVFGSGEYLTDLIAAQNHEDYGTEDETPEDKWRLVVIEDAEEFLIPNAKHEIGQAVSRLLNVGDGILGQGLKLLIMLTTNVPVEKLSPAITRPGRCLANIEVPAMSRDEAAKWLGRDAAGPATLAELWESKHPSQIGTGISTKLAPGQYL